MSANLISTKVSTSHRKCTQALAKRSRKLTQVFNLRQLASPFGQGLRIVNSWALEQKKGLRESSFNMAGVGGGGMKILRGGFENF